LIFKKVKKVKFVGATDDQMNWGGENDNPNDVLIKGNEYYVICEDVHSWHTNYQVKGYEDKWFPRGAFRDV